MFQPNKIIKSWKSVNFDYSQTILPDFNETQTIVNDNQDVLFRSLMFHEREIENQINFPPIHKIPIRIGFNEEEHDTKTKNEIILNENEKD